MIQRYVPRTRRALGHFLRLHPAPWRWQAGAEAALALGLPLVLFTAVGQQGWGLQAGLGSFTALYGASLGRGGRRHLLPLVALGLVLAAAVGVAGAGNRWLTSAGLVVVSTLAAALTLGFRLGPPGPLMFVLVAAVSGHLTTPATLGGVGLPGLPLVGLVALGAALAYAVIVLPLAWPAVRRRHSTTPTLRQLLPRFALGPDAMVVLRRVVAGVATASLVGPYLGAYRPYWVVLATVAVVQASASWQLTSIRAAQRVLGTLLGLGVFELLMLLHPTGFGLVVLLVLLLAATEVVVARNYALALLFITPLALTNATAGHPGSLLVPLQGRFLDTLLGAGIALLIVWLDEWRRQAR